MTVLDGTPCKGSRGECSTAGVLRSQPPVVAVNVDNRFKLQGQHAGRGEFKR
uniref:Uncharacterized protein n=1 Tax=Hyaloperonospora arabidopsidis (strain Emoy2) TaxID=559515 RepID=M4BYP3_HYAAE